VHSSRAEEIHQWTTDPGAQRTRAAGAACATTDRKWTGRSLICRQRRVEVRHHQVAANGVGVDGPVEMTPAVEVVGERKRVPPAKIALNGKVSLLRVRVDEIPGLRISEWLEAQRQESRLRRVRQVEIQVILVQENRLREV